MEQVEIDAVGLQALQAALAGGDHPGAAGIVGIDLAYDEDLAPAALDGFGDDLLGPALGIHLGGVDEAHAEIEAEAQRRHLVLVAGPALAHLPRPLAQDRDLLAVRQASAANGAHRPNSRIAASRPSRVKGYIRPPIRRRIICRD